MHDSRNRPFDPAIDMHFALSEEAHIRLQTVRQAAEVVGQLFRQSDPGAGGVCDEGVAALFEAIAFAIDGATAEQVFVAPPRRNSVVGLKEVH